MPERGLYQMNRRTAIERMTGARVPLKAEVLPVGDNLATMPKRQSRRRSRHPLQPIRHIDYTYQEGVA